MVDLRQGAAVCPLYKLVSRRGTLLGTITFPADWEDRLLHEGVTRFAAQKWDDVVRYLPPPGVSEEVPPIRIGALYLERIGPNAGAVCLHGLTPEEFEALPGCTFAPGAGYLRSLMEG